MMMQITKLHRIGMATGLLAGAVCLLACPGRACAQKVRKDQATPPRETITPPEDALPPEFGTVEQIMKQAVRNIAARYNLNEEQTRLTDEMMTERVTRFLREHHDEVWPAIRTLVSSQIKGQPPTDQAEVMRVGRVARPLAELARKEIFDANAEWREWLTEGQKELHDFDLAEMEKTFDGIDDNLRSWAEGHPKDPGIFPPPRVYPNEPEKPDKPDPGLPTAKSDKPDKRAKTTPKPVVSTLSPGMFEAFVEEFIKDYDLDTAQVESARSILRDIKGRAESYLDTNKEKIAKAAAAQERAVKQRDNEARKQADEEHRALLEPVNELFQKMEERLRALLTTAQRERYEQNQAKKTKAGDSSKDKASPKKQTPKSKKTRKSTSKSRP
jgi:hypothetical protein